MNPTVFVFWSLTGFAGVCLAMGVAVRLLVGREADSREAPYAGDSYYASSIANNLLLIAAT